MVATLWRIQRRKEKDILDIDYWVSAVLRRYSPPRGNYIKLGELNLWMEL